MALATTEEVAAFIAKEFPQTKCGIRAVGNGAATVVHEIGHEELRPGGTVSGPTLMAVADLALYTAILGDIGIVPLAVTTSLTINFLRKPRADRAIVGECRLMKSGRTLAVGVVWLYSEGETEPVAHVVGTYAIPPVIPSRRGGRAVPGRRARASSRET
jgi:acyl-coenzyme A thioesterase PaaI-like protein